jgi:hypothetical protein
VFPLQSWYHAGFDKEAPLLAREFLDVERVLPFEKKWGDFHQCLWPGVLKEDFSCIDEDKTILARGFAALNEPFLRSQALDERNEHETIVSFSHFVPRQELMPEKRFLLEPHLTKVIGSDFLEEQIRRIQPDIHLFGHTHIPIDLFLDGVRYIQWPLGYFREADKQCKPIFISGPLLIHDSKLGTGHLGIPVDIQSRQTYWTKYYEANTRIPKNIELSPWLKERLNGYSGLVLSSKKEDGISAAAATTSDR